MTEAVNPQRQFFGEERLHAAVTSFSASENTAEETVLRVRSAVDAFCAGNEAFDDMAVLALVYTGNEGARESLPVALSAFDTIKNAVFAAAGDEPETRQALLACDEALSNIVYYSGASSLDFSCKTDGGRFRVAFSDNGVPFDPTAVISENREFERLDNGGMGLNLIRRCVSSMHYERKEDRNILTLFFPCRHLRNIRTRGIPGSLLQKFAVCPGSTHTIFLNRDPENERERCFHREEIASPECVPACYGQKRFTPVVPALFLPM